MSQRKTHQQASAELTDAVRAIGADLVDKLRVVVEVGMCGCGHPAANHTEQGCQEWWRYPDVLDARQCGCKGVWTRDD